MKKFLFILIFPVVIAAFSSVAFSAGRNNSRQNVLNDDWEDGWEESFFEKEAGRKQILKKENERPVVTPRSNRPKKQEKEESVRLPSREELEASEEQKNSDSEYYDKLISAAEKKQAAANSASPSYFSLHPDNARYFAFKLFQGNMNLRDNSIGKGYGPALGIGFKKKALRGEFDFDYVYEEAYNSHSSKFRGFSGMFNVFADLNISGTPELTPYIGFGAGVSHIRLRTPEWHGNGCAFSWQAAAGISYAFSPKFAVDIGYRYFDYGTPRIQHTDYSFDSKQFFLEMKYFF